MNSSPGVPVQNLQTELISTRKTSHRQQRRPELPTVTPTWHASKCKVHNLHHPLDTPLVHKSYVPCIYSHARWEAFGWDYKPRFLREYIRMQKDRIRTLNILLSMSEFGGLWKHWNNPWRTKSVRAFRVLKLDTIRKKELSYATRVFVTVLFVWRL